MLNILFVACSGEIDYECHCLFHGLHELKNTTVYTLNDQPYMFADYPSEKRRLLYGMGFTIAAKIDPFKKHHQSKEEVEKCIMQHFYDLVIYGSIHRCLDLWDLVRDHYKKEEIICVDGEDWITPNCYANFDYNVRMLEFKLPLYKYLGKEKSANFTKFLLKEINRREEILNKCISCAIVFKRELNLNLYPQVKPISFAIPSSIIVNKSPVKSRRLAFIQPGKPETYIYKTEEDYYKGYQESYWGLTTKKAGWDCLRHYEIMANGCIPYFPDIYECPNEIMVDFPKEIIKYTNYLFDNNVQGGWEVKYYLNQLVDYTRAYLTTKELANYVLSSLS